MNRTEVLEAARHCVCGERQQDYGSPENNFANIAALWEAYTGRSYTPVEVAVMLALLKVARIKSGRKADNFVDLAGYAALAGELADLETAADQDQEPATEPAAEDQDPVADQDQEPDPLPAWVEDLKNADPLPAKGPRECWPAVCESCQDADRCKVAPEYLSPATEPAADQDQEPAADQDQEPAADQDQEPRELSPLERFVQDIAESWAIFTRNFHP